MVPSLNDLRSVRWDVLGKVYGSFHSTLIGLMVDWWVSLPSANRTALESGTTYAYHKKGQGSRKCDALLLADGKAVGVLEVEGNLMCDSMRRMCQFLDVRDGHYWKNVEFGVFVAYAYSPSGEGKARSMPPVDFRRSEILDIVRNEAKKPVLLIGVNRRYQTKEELMTQASERMNGNELYYRSEVSDVFAQVLGSSGTEETSVIWQRNHA